MKRCAYLMLALIAGSQPIALQAEEQHEPRVISVKLKQNEHPQYIIKTSKGEFVIELDREKAPESVKNFINYVEAGFYRETIFHRVIPGFVIQGGGFTSGFVQKPTKPPIRNEATNGLKNTRGSLAMARTGVVDSATAQFYINLSDNGMLDHSGNSPERYGYAVFGHVISGMDVVDAIAALPTATRGPYQDVPKETVEIIDVVPKTNG